MPLELTYAVKSADAVAALRESGLSLACQTAPLWPMKVPILDMSEGLKPISRLSYQSPLVPLRSIGLPSDKRQHVLHQKKPNNAPLQAEIM